MKKGKKEEEALESFVSVVHETVYTYTLARAACADSGQARIHNTAEKRQSFSYKKRKMGS